MSYINKKREHRKYFKEGTDIFRFSLLQFERLESIAFSVCEDYLNTRIVNEEDISLMENQIVSSLDTLSKEGIELLGRETFEGYLPTLEKNFSLYMIGLREIFIDKENDKVQRVHSLSLKASDAIISELRDYYLSCLQGDKHE